MSTVDGIVAGQGTEQAESSWAECGRVVYIPAHSKGPDPAVCTSVSHQVAVAVVVEIDQEHFLVPHRQGTARCSPAAALKEVGVRPRKTMILQAVKGRWGVVQARKIIMREGCPPQRSLLRQQGTPMTLPSDPDFKTKKQTFLLE